MSVMGFIGAFGGVTRSQGLVAAIVPGRTLRHFGVPHLTARVYMFVQALQHSDVLAPLTGFAGDRTHVPLSLDGLHMFLDRCVSLWCSYILLLRYET